jgi:ATP-dependent Lon protease
MTVYKSARRSRQFAALSLPSYLRDWLVMRFADSAGQMDMDEVYAFIRKTIPRREDWEALKSRMVNGGQAVRFLAKVQVEIDVRSGEGLFSLPDFGFPRRRYEAIIESRLVRERRDDLLRSSETWGVIDLEWRVERLGSSQEEGHIVMVDFSPFRPYRIELGFYQQARAEFTLEEWSDQLLMAIDYNPAGFESQREKLTMLARLLPFVEKRLNLIELAPKGTGKSYVFQQLSKYGWLVSGGSIGRPRLFYNVASKTPGLVSRYDYVALDEIQSIIFQDEEEVRGALKGYMESGEYRIGDYRGVGEAAIVLLGNIDIESMDVELGMLDELPQSFRESALIDRFHGFIKGWDIPRMRENLKAEGWGLNTEYISEILHALRDDVRYRAVVDTLLKVPKGADTRDTEAIKRLCTAWVKLLFPQAISADKLDVELFRRYCLEPSQEMRGVIRKQLHRMDSEYGEELPEISGVTPEGAP